MEMKIQDVRTIIRVLTGVLLKRMKVSQDPNETDTEFRK